MSENWSPENSEFWSFSTDSVGEGLLLGCICRICLGRFFGLVGTGIVIFEICGRFIFLRLSFLFIIWIAVGDGIDVLFWFVLLFLFNLDLFVLSNNSIFFSKDIFRFPSILFLGWVLVAVRIRDLNLIAYVDSGIYYLFGSRYFS